MEQEYRSWEDLSPLEQAAQIYSDMHKDAYGFRPREGGVHNPQTLEDYNRAFEAMQSEITEEEAREKARQKKALEKVQAEIEALKVQFNLDRESALRWWFEAEGSTCKLDREHTLWGRGIAFSDFPLFGESAY